MQPKKKLNHKHLITFSIRSLIFVDLENDKISPWKQRKGSYLQIFLKFCPELSDEHLIFNFYITTILHSIIHSTSLFLLLCNGRVV